MRKIFALSLLLLVMALLTACGDDNYNGEYEHIDDYAYEDVTDNDYIAEYEKADDCDIRARYLEDIDFLYNTLVANFPMINALERRGFDFHDRFGRARRTIEGHSNLSDQTFMMILDHYIFMHPIVFGTMAGSGHQPFGHLGMMRNSTSVLGSFRHGYQVYWDILDNPATRTFYNFDDSHFASRERAGDADAEPILTDIEFSSVATDILEEGRIAYIQIPRMASNNSERDRLYLLDFFKQIGNYEHLIVDIRGNPGGEPLLFINWVIAPNIAEPLQYCSNSFIMAGEHNMRFVEYFGMTLLPVTYEILGRFEGLHPEDAVLFDYFIETEEEIKPSEENPIFTGKIWLLIDELNFSAAEYVAALVKQTGFATLVGTQTNGGGMGMFAVMAAMPNTGIVIRYRPVYQVDEQGRNSYEHGTIPDIFNFEGMDALETALATINAE